MCATNKCDNDPKKWCFLLKQDGYQKMCDINKTVTKMIVIIRGFIVLFFTNYLVTSHLFITYGRRLVVNGKNTTDQWCHLFSYLYRIHFLQNGLPGETRYKLGWSSSTTESQVTKGIHGWCIHWCGFPVLDIHWVTCFFMASGKGASKVEVWWQLFKLFNTRTGKFLDNSKKVLSTLEQGH